MGVSVRVHIVGVGVRMSMAVRVRWSGHDDSQCLDTCWNAWYSETNEKYFVSWAPILACYDTAQTWLLVCLLYGSRFPRRGADQIRLDKQGLEEGTPAPPAGSGAACRLSILSARDGAAPKRAPARSGMPRLESCPMVPVC